jgi:hypothetical protein
LKKSSIGDRSELKFEEMGKKKSRRSINKSRQKLGGRSKVLCSIKFRWIKWGKKPSNGSDDFDKSNQSKTRAPEVKGVKCMHKE